MPRPIETPAAPLPAGHYSQAIVHGGLVYVAGQLPIDPETRRPLAGAEVEAQTERALRNLQAVLEAAGSRLDLVLRVTVYVADVALCVGVGLLLLTMGAQPAGSGGRR